MKKRFEVALRLKGQPAPEKIQRAKFIVECVNGNTWFPNPFPSVEQLQQTIENTENAFIDSRSLNRTKMALFHALIEDLEVLLYALGSYVETIANLNREHGEEIILSAGIDLKHPFLAKAHEFKIKHGAMQGAVVARAKWVGKLAAYIWEYRKASDEKWIQAAITQKAKYTFTDLEIGVKYQFRYRSVNAKEDFPWSQILELIVV